MLLVIRPQEATSLPSPKAAAASSASCISPDTSPQSRKSSTPDLDQISTVSRHRFSTTTTTRAKSRRTAIPISHLQRLSTTFCQQRRLISGPPSWTSRPSTLSMLLRLIYPIREISRSYMSLEVKTIRFHHSGHSHSLTNRARNLQWNILMRIMFRC